MMMMKSWSLISAMGRQSSKKPIAIINPIIIFISNVEKSLLRVLLEQTRAIALNVL